MAFEYVTLEEVRDHLRYDDDANDTMLTAYTLAAEKAVKNYIKADVPSDAAHDIKVAVLLLVGYFDNYRNVDQDAPNYGNYLPDPVRMMLIPYRKATVV